MTATTIEVVFAARLTDVQMQALDEFIEISQPAAWTIHLIGPHRIERAFHFGVLLGITIFGVGILVGWWLQGRFS